MPKLKTPPTTLTIEMWPIDRPKPYPKNARKWGPRAIEKVAASIREFGFRQPIVVDADEVIIMGHLRQAAGRSLNLTHVPVHVARDLSPEQVKALRLADNRTHDESTFDMHLVGQDLMELKMADFDLDLTAFEMPEVMAGIFEEDAGGNKNRRKLPGESIASGALRFQVIVDAESEQHQSELLKRFRDQGLKVKPLIS